jgi:hypothetical protein
MKLAAFLIPFIACTQVQAADDTLIINGTTYKKVESVEYLKPAFDVAPVYELNAKEEARMKLLGETIATKTLMYTRKLSKAARLDELNEWKKDHPKLAMVRKYSGYGVFNDRVLLPASDWWVDHEGLGIGCAAVGSLASMGLLAGGAAR